MHQWRGEGGVRAGTDHELDAVGRVGAAHAPQLHLPRAPVEDALSRAHPPPPDKAGAAAVAADGNGVTTTSNDQALTWPWSQHAALARTRAHRAAPFLEPLSCVSAQVRKICL